MTREEFIKALPRGLRKIYTALLQGGKHSVTELTIRTHLADPRSHIKRLRDKGVQVLDEWRNTADRAGRFKVYYIPRNNA